MTYPRLVLDEYRALVSGLVRPARQQMEDFAQYVSNAHSWYKHLPLLPPGAPFSFRLDPAAGMQRILDGNGTLRAEPLEQGAFHYSSLPTAEYRERFGYLAFSQAGGTTVTLVAKDGTRMMPSDGTDVVLDLHLHRLVGIPIEILEAGTARLTGLIHSHIDERLLHRGLLAAGPGAWPEASGGAATYHAILERSKAIATGKIERETLAANAILALGNVGLLGADHPLHLLLAPERERQRNAMVTAMEGMLALL